jgi:Zn finger protein HypA/HybF involved in hydrogenase expression
MKRHSVQYRKRAKLLAGSGITYSEFLQSGLWAQIKAELRTLPEYQKCWCCSAKDNLQFHHLTYRAMFISNINVNRERIKALCGECHKAVHDLCKVDGLGIKQATKRYKKMVSRRGANACSPAGGL